MDIGGLRATVHGVAESDSTEVTDHTYMHLQGNKVKMKKRKQNKTKIIESKWERHVVFMGLKEINQWINR